MHGNLHQELGQRNDLLFTESGAKVYEIEGPLFFSSANSFLEIFKPEEDPEVVIIDFAGSKVIDQSALKAIEDIADRYSKHRKKS